MITTKNQLQQLLGCTNWVRYYLVHVYPALIKMIGKYLKPDAVFPYDGLGAKDTVDDRVIRAIRLCVCYHSHLAVLDEAAAMDGTCPLELLADCPGIAWGGSAHQMLSDRSSSKS